MYLCMHTHTYVQMSVKSDDSGLGPSVEGHVRHSHSGDGTHHRAPLKTTNVRNY